MKRAESTFCHLEVDALFHASLNHDVSSIIQLLPRVHYRNTAPLDCRGN